MGQIKVRGKMQRVAVTPSVTMTLGFLIINYSLLRINGNNLVFLQANWGTFEAL
jgi:hypothetical protein